MQANRFNFGSDRNPGGDNDCTRVIISMTALSSGAGIHYHSAWLSARNELAPILVAAVGKDFCNRAQAGSLCCRCLRSQRSAEDCKISVNRARRPRDRLRHIAFSFRHVPQSAVCFQV